MGKRKITPLLVATIITAGIATGVHSFKLPVLGQSHTTITSRTNRNKKNEHKASDSEILARKNESLKRNSLLPKSNNTLDNTKGKSNIKSSISNTSTKKIQNTQNTEIKKPQSDINTHKTTSVVTSESHTFNAPVHKETKIAAPTHKVSPKHSFVPKPANNIQSKPSSNKSSIVSSTNSIKTVVKHKPHYNSPIENNKLSLPGGNINVNGSTISSQLKSDSSIAQTARDITSSCSNDYQKAQALYVWVARNMYYSKSEENAVLNGNESTNCGAINAFNTREGICEDFSTLYAVMANDAGLTTRVVAGQGFGNDHWISHAWNQVYIPSMGWINVDTTFANSYIALINANNLPFNADGILSTESYYTYRTSQYSYKIYTEDYFNTQNFNTTHKNAEVLAQLGSI